MKPDDEADILLFLARTEALSDDRPKEKAEVENDQEVGAIEEKQHVPNASPSRRKGGAGIWVLLAVALAAFALGAIIF